jgi:hypothetical protein
MSERERERNDVIRKFFFLLTDSFIRIALTLYKDEVTNARRGTPIPQLTCVAGVCDRADLLPDVVQCVSSGIGADGMPQWRCEAQLDDGVRLGRVQVSCEGYNDPQGLLFLKLFIIAVFPKSCHNRLFRYKTNKQTLILNLNLILFFLK